MQGSHAWIVKPHARSAKGKQAAGAASRAAKAVLANGIS
jgi:hypothetical protein